jgi:serine/threonine protein kinase
MNKKQTLSKEKRSIVLIVLCFLSLNLNGTFTILNFDPKNNFLDRVAQNSEEREFLIDIVDLHPGFFSKKNHFFKINPKNCLGRGEYGEVFLAELFCNQQRFVVKRALPKREEDLMREYHNAQDLYIAMLNVLRSSCTTHTKIPGKIWYGMKSLVCSVGKTQNGCLYQKWVNGRNVFDTIVGGIPPYRNGYPNNLVDAILRAADFFSTLATLHKLGFIFGDIRRGNVVIENGPQAYKAYINSEDIDWLYEPFLNHPCRIIDFALLTRIGNFLPYYIVNQSVKELPEEYWNTHKVFFTYQNRIDKIDDRLANIASQLKNVIATQQKYEGIRSNRYWNNLYSVISLCTCDCIHAPTDEDMAQLDLQRQNLEEQSTVLRQEINNLLQEQRQQTSIALPCAYPSFDIHQSVPVLEALLFGVLGISERPRSWDDIMEVRRKIFQATGQTYPEYVFLALLELLESMTYSDPNQRPSAEFIADRLYALGTGSWE